MPTWRGRTPIEWPAGARHDRNQTKAQRLGPTRLQPKIRETGVVPIDLASPSALKEATRAEVRPSGFDEETRNETIRLW